jgi:hypothetical protein
MPESVRKMLAEIQAADVSGGRPGPDRRAS